MMAKNFRRRRVSTEVMRPARLEGAPDRVERSTSQRDEGGILAEKFPAALFLDTSRILLDASKTHCISHFLL